jgi:pilus assembly protein CpaC
MYTSSSARPLRRWVIVCGIAAFRASVPAARGQPPVPPPPGEQVPAPLPAGAVPGQSPSIVHRVQAANERMDMVVNTSRVLTLDQKIPRAQVNNPEILDLVPLSPTQVQISGKKAGATQVNLWSEDGRIYTIDVMVFADARELSMILRTQFPKASLSVIPVGGSVLVSGYVDQQENIPAIMRIAEEYYPKVINRMTVSGVQQVLLHVKIMEVSRTKLRTLGFDFANVTGGSIVQSGVSGLLATSANATLDSGVGGIVRTGAGSFRVDAGRGGSTFFGVLDALRQDNLAKILAEPTLVTVSGRPASFHVGGSFTVIPQGLAAAQPMQINWGTNVDFVPIVLGSGRIRLEVRPVISQIDPSVTVNGVPGLLDRAVDTGTEMRAGQTLAIAGLVQNRVEAENRGLPWVSELPYVGAAFRRVQEKQNELELLILVTPELVEAMDACQVPPCGPGMDTRSPTDCELFLKGHLEMPNCCPPGGCPAGVSGGPGSAVVADGPCAQNVPGQNNPQSPSRPNGVSTAAAAHSEEPAFIGPLGYDVLK